MISVCPDLEAQNSGHPGNLTQGPDTHTAETSRDNCREESGTNAGNYHTKTLLV